MESVVSELSELHEAVKGLSILAQALNFTLTENKALAHKSTESTLVDLFYQLVRGAPLSKLQPLIAAAWTLHPHLTVKMAFQTRAIMRKGQSQGTGKQERELFYIFCTQLPLPVVLHNLEHVPFYGTWKDLLELAVRLPSLKPRVVQLFAQQLLADQKSHTPGTISLAAKWAPNEGHHYDKKLKMAKAIREELKLNAKGYRKLLVSLRGPLLETKLCSGVPLEIKDYSAMPSQAMTYYRKSLKRTERHPNFPAYLEAVKKARTETPKEKDPEVKMHVATLMPHQIVAALPDRLCEEQWRGLVEEYKAKGTFKNMLPLVDVSGSMDCAISNKSQTNCLTVAVSLGLMCAALCEGPYRNQVMTFTREPAYHVVSPEMTLQQQVELLKRAPWHMNTDFNKAIRLLLRTALEHKVPELPTLIVFSDMQFDSVGSSDTNDQAIRKLFAAHNYPVPRIVYWNLRGDTRVNFPVTAGSENVQMLSGFSPSILKMVMRNELKNPQDTIMAILQDPYFDKITLPAR